jgi:uroporphyrinogen-III decarboxylase
MTPLLTSRERMLRAIHCQEVDYTPCTFMSFSAMRGRCQDAYEVALRELEMGLDSMLFIPSSWRGARPNHPDLRGLPVRLPPEVRVDLWVEELPGESCPILHKVYHTPAGSLSTAVRKTPDWPHGNAIPLMDDYQVPRAVKPLVTSFADLEALRSLLIPPSREDAATYLTEAERARAFSQQHGILVAGGWGVGADMAGWLCGLENMAVMEIEQPDLLAALLDTISRWNHERMRMILGGGIDLFIRRAWYESTQFWSPRLYRKFLLPRLQQEVRLAHEHGVPFGYIMTSGMLPMAENILESGVDVLLGLDPLQQGANPLAEARQRLGGQVCLWGGVNAAITVEQGSADDVRREVFTALDTMRGENGFILSPVDNITEVTLNTWRNIDVLIETWQQHQGTVRN